MQKGCLTLAVLIYGFFSISADAQSKNKQPASTYKIAKEGIGVEGITVGKSDKKDVEKKFGKSYKLVKNGKYSFQMIYKNGLSFYLCQTDKKQEIFDIEIRSPYRVKTLKGIKLRESTLEDVNKIYGKAKEGLRYRGVEFYYTKIKGKNIVTVIDIVEPKGLRQCEENK
ncbi:MAG: DUF4309 domain-containing protein [Pyrinomonadaceae bacterium]